MTMHGWKTKFEEIRKEFRYREKDDFLSAKKLNSLLERMILQNPDQWIWSHNRWK